MIRVISEWWGGGPQSKAYLCEGPHNSPHNKVYIVLRVYVGVIGALAGSYSSYGGG